MWKVNTAIAVVLVFVACCFNVASLEKLVKYSPGCGTLVTFSQFAFIACNGAVTVAKFGTQKPVVPIRDYLLAVALFYGSSLSGNIALGCHISMPIQMIFKSGSVLASLALGVFLLKRRYPTSKYIAVVMISVGISMCLLVSSKGKQTSVDEAKEFNQLVWMFGIFLLAASLFLGARLGIAQEQITIKYGKQPMEMLFYTHALAIPGFFIFAEKIVSEGVKFSESEKYVFPLIGVGVPVMWLYLFGNVITQFLCIRSVYILTTEISALAVTVLLTFRKFLSLVISIVYFQNAFTGYHWVGSSLVFGGTLLFSGVLHDFLGMINKEKLKAKDE